MVAETREDDCYLRTAGTIQNISFCVTFNQKRNSPYCSPFLCHNQDYSEDIIIDEIVTQGKLLFHFARLRFKTSHMVTHSVTLHLNLVSVSLLSNFSLQISYESI